MLLCQVLTRERYRVIAVDNGRLACEAVRRERPDVVLLDWRMPVMDGRAALQELKASKDTRGIPIVMLTSQSQVDERILALESGVQDFLSKPFDPRELVACIEQQLRWQHGLALDARAAFLEERNALLAASERRYRLLAEAMPHMVWMADAGGKITYVNRAWSEYTGKDLLACSVDGWATTVYPADRLAALRGWNASLATGEPFEIQCRFRRAADDVYRWHLGRAIPTSDADGRIVEWIGSCADVHDFKIASETRALLDSIGSVVMIRTEAGFVDYASPNWDQYTGSHSGAGPGYGWRDFVHPDDLPVADRAHDRIAGSAGAPHQYELRIRGSDGVYRWFLSRSTLLPHVEGTPRRWLDTSTDVDDLKRAQSALEVSQTRYRALTDSMPQMVWVSGQDARVEYVNHRWSDYTGLSAQQTQERGQAAIVHSDDLTQIANYHDGTDPVEYVCEARFRRADGVYRWHMVRAVPFHDAADQVGKWIGTATDIEDSKAAATQLAQAAAELEHLAHHDPVTNLPNRMLLVERLAAAIALAQRNRTGVIVLYLDLDRFKIVNDTLGHAAGDRVLAVTAKRIADALRAGDTASRVGGDEFVLVCATSEGAEDAGRVAARLHAAIGQPIDVGAQSVSVGASIGISLYPADGLLGEELVEKADTAMYAAKQSGRNAFRLYSADAHTSIVASLNFETELREAIRCEQFVVHYQPIVSFATGEPIGAEAFVRWKHPERGTLAPENFLAFAEEHRLMGAIGAIVLDAVCAQIAALPATLDAAFTIAMNVSARQFTEPRFIEALRAAIALHDIDPHRLEIEIAEHVALGDQAIVLARLVEMQRLGVRISIDNFGTGYSSLASIRGYPISCLKIDRTFIHDIVASPKDQAVAKTIITLGHSLGVRVVAEGVETAAQVEALRAFGSDAFQGYLTSRPMDARDFDRFLRTSRSANVTPEAPVFASARDLEQIP